MGHGEEEDSDDEEDTDPVPLATTNMAAPLTVVAEAWYFIDSVGNRNGPHLPSALRTKLLAAQVDGMTMVWRAGMAQWKPIAEVEELRPVLMVEESDEEEGASKADPDMVMPEESAIPVVEESAAKPAKEKRKRKNRKRRKWVQSDGCSIYVSGLPLDTSLDEVTKCFAQCGVFKKDLHGMDKVKLYKDELGNLKGDATISYMKIESVDLAIMMRDQYQLREGNAIKVQKAEYAQKGDYKQAMETDLDKLKRKKQRQRVAETLLGWNEGEDRGKGICIVILKKMFDKIQVAVGDLDYYELLQKDVQEECEANVGEVEKITVFPNSEEGVIAVRFKASASAEKCIELMNGRFFAGKSIIAEYYDGFSDYRVEKEDGGIASLEHSDPILGDTEEARRLDKFADWLEGDSGDNTDDEIRKSQSEFVNDQQEEEEECYKMARAGFPPDDDEDARLNSFGDWLEGSGSDTD